MQEIKKVGVFSIAKISLLFGILFGLLVGIAFATTGNNLPIEDVPVELVQIVYSPWAIIIMPILYGIGYFLSGLIGGFLYNVFAGWVGGVKVSFSASSGSSARMKSSKKKK